MAQEFSEITRDQSEKYASSVGSCLTALRRTKFGADFSTFAADLGMNPLTYTNWESGKNGVPTQNDIEDWVTKGGFSNGDALSLYTNARLICPESRIGGKSQSENPLTQEQFSLMIDSMNDLVNNTPQVNTTVSNLKLVFGLARAVVKSLYPSKSGKSL